MVARGIRAWHRWTANYNFEDENYRDDTVYDNLLEENEEIAPQQAEGAVEDNGRSYSYSYASSRSAADLLEPGMSSWDGSYLRKHR